MRALVTGGIGFIGTNLSHRLLSDGNEVILFDNLSRAGVQHNLDWLKATHGKELQFVQGDIRDFDAVLTAIQNVDAVYTWLECPNAEPDDGGPGSPIAVF